MVSCREQSDVRHEDRRCCLLSGEVNGEEVRTFQVGSQEVVRFRRGTFVRPAQHLRNSATDSVMSPKMTTASNREVREVVDEVVRDRGRRRECWKE